MGQSTKGEAAAESQPLPSTSAGSSPPVQTTTRKRPRPSAQQPKSLPPKHTSSDIPADGAASTEGEGVQSGSRRRATLQTPQCNSEDQSQQSFHAMGLIEQVGLPEMIRLADQHSVVWCRVKGFPAWPVSYTCWLATSPLQMLAFQQKTCILHSTICSYCYLLTISEDHLQSFVSQFGSTSTMYSLAVCQSVVLYAASMQHPLQAQIMTAAAAKLRLGQDPKSARLPIMFFGTTEITWSSSKDVYSWGQGIKDDLWSKNKQRNRQLFDLGVEQVPFIVFVCSTFAAYISMDTILSIWQICYSCLDWTSRKQCCVHQCLRRLVLQSVYLQSFCKISNKRQAARLPASSLAAS